MSGMKRFLGMVKNYPLLSQCVYLFLSFLLQPFFLPQNVKTHFSKVSSDPLDPSEDLELAAGVVIMSVMCARKREERKKERKVSPSLFGSRDLLFSFHRHKEDLFRASSFILISFALQRTRN